jgi:MFS transporter, DHA1 family, multidrug resistance protein
MTIGILPTPFISSLPALYALQFITGFGRGLLYPVLMSLAIKTAPPKDRAAAMGIFQAVYAFGMFVGPSLSGSISDSYGVDAVFYICGLMTLGCVPVLIALTRRTAPTSANA